MRGSDDGEPSGTAGRPMLEVLLGEELHDVLAVVTRYFGGTLLGTGGLVRAYSAAVKEGLSKTEVIERLSGKKVKIQTDYNGIGKLQYIMGQLGVTELQADYGENVELIVAVPEETVSKFQKEVIEASGGRAVMEELGRIYYSEIEGKMEVWTC